MDKGHKLFSRIDRGFLSNMLKIALPIMIQNLVYLHLIYRYHNGRKLR